MWNVRLTSIQALVLYLLGGILLPGGHVLWAGGCQAEAHAFGDAHHAHEGGCHHGDPQDEQDHHHEHEHEEGNEAPDREHDGGHCPDHCLPCQTLKGLHSTPLALFLTTSTFESVIWQTFRTPTEPTPTPPENHDGIRGPPHGASLA